MQIKISVITVTFNCANVIESTIESILAQTYDNVELLIIDGRSTDGTVDIINRYKKHIDYFVSEKDNGIYDAMNKGLLAATGDWVIFMNAGDFFVDKDVLKKVFVHILDDTDVIYGDIIKQYDGYYYHAVPAGLSHAAEVMPVFHQATFVRLSYHKQHLFDCSFKSSGDYNFFYKCYFNDHCNFQYIPEIVACFDSKGGMSKDNHGLSMRENLRIWGKEKDYLFRIRLECRLLKHDIKKFVKQKILNKDRARKIKMIRHVREGKQVIEGEFNFIR